MAHPTVTHLKMRRRDEDLKTTVQRVYGHRATCGCGWEGEVRQKHGTARWDALVHYSERHAG
jgi:hypothetical protein